MAKPGDGNTVPPSTIDLYDPTDHTPAEIVMCMQWSRLNVTGLSGYSLRLS
jgi:hypothetical protein